MFSFLSSRIKYMQKIDDLNCKVGKYTQSYWNLAISYIPVRKQAFNLLSSTQICA